MAQEFYGDRVSAGCSEKWTRPRTSVENFKRVRQAFSRSSIKSIGTAARELELPPTTVHKVLHKKLRLYDYKVQMLQRLQPNGKPKRKEFADNMLQRISEDEKFLKRICFSDEATFHVSGKLNKHNVRIWGSEHPHEIRELERDSPKSTRQEIEYRLDVLRVIIEMYQMR